MQVDIFESVLQHYYLQSVEVDTAEAYYGDAMGYADKDYSGFITTEEFYAAKTEMGPFLWDQFVDSGIYDEELYDLFYWPLNFTYSDLNEDGNVTWSEYEMAELNWELFLSELTE